MSGTMYLVVRRAVCAAGRGCADQFCTDTGSRVPIRLFAARGPAERFVADLYAEAHRTMNPFQLNDYPDALHTKLKQLGLPPRCLKELQGDLVVWWDRVADELTDEQRAAVWGLFDVPQPYEIVPVEVE
jgi:hypothetical protein